MSDPCCNFHATGGHVDDRHGQDPAWRIYGWPEGAATGQTTVATATGRGTYVKHVGATVIVDGIEWRARLIPLEWIDVTRDGIGVHATWDRMTLWGAKDRPIPRELTLALREAITRSESP
jgi:hypothetical protein